MNPPVQPNILYTRPELSNNINWYQTPISTQQQFNSRQNLLRDIRKEKQLRPIQQGFNNLLTGISYQNPGLPSYWQQQDPRFQRPIQHQLSQGQVYNLARNLQRRR